MTTDVEALLERAKIAEEVAALKAGTDMSGLLSDGDNKGAIKDISDPMRLVPLYATATGEPRAVPIWTLEGKNSILLRKNADGTPVFSSQPPTGKPWKQGSYPCLLAATHPDRDKYMAMGLGIDPCAGEHLASPYAVEMHMRHRHSQEWMTIQNADARERESEDRAWRRIQMQVAQQTLNGQQASPVKTCEKCGGAIEGTDSFAVARHNKNCPGKDGA